MSAPKGLIATGAAKVEALLLPLIKQHGLARVMSDLEKLVGSASWSDWQQVANIARNVARRIERNSNL